MKVVFVSNFYNHHQAFISRKLYSFSGVDYSFVSTTSIPSERKALGYNNSADKFVVQYNGLNRKTVDSMIKSADVLILGSSKHIRISRKRKLIFRYSERPFKREPGAIRIVKNYIVEHIKNQLLFSPVLLCASAYAAYDYSRLGLFKDKAYKWGYFPETRHYDLVKLYEKKNKKEILWCGRLLDWKHPEMAISVAQRLKADKYDFSLNIIGVGALQLALQQMVGEYHLEEYVHFLGSMSPESVREHMERAGIFLFTSDRQEGWGAVLNESMNSGCAVVASHAIGAVPYLMKNNENGLIYQSGDIDSLYKNVKLLLDSPDEQRRLGEAAYHTITEEWNAEIAAERFVNLAQHILDGEKYPDIYRSGPCSRANIINDTAYLAKME